MRSVLRDVSEEHLCQEVVFDSKYFVQIGFHRIEGQVLLAFLLILLGILVKLIQIDVPKSIEELEDVWQEFFVDLGL